MRLTNQIKPISYIKSNAAEVLADLEERGEPYIITVNGEAKAILMDLATWEADQEAQAFRQIVALETADIAAGRVVPAEEVFARAKARLTDQ
jgi:prevent-host-death family protein